MLQWCAGLNELYEQKRSPISPVWALTSVSSEDCVSVCGVWVLSACSTRACRSAAQSHPTLLFCPFVDLHLVAVFIAASCVVFPNNQRFCSIFSQTATEYSVNNLEYGLAQPKHGFRCDCSQTDCCAALLVAVKSTPRGWSKGNLTLYIGTF